MTELRCTCGAWDKIAEAFERIFGTRNRIAMILSKNDREIRIVSDEPPMGVIARAKYSYEQFYDLSFIISELADEIDPPKPKEREWQVGDVAMRDIENPIIVSEVCDHTFKYGPNQIYQEYKSLWRNLSIEAEKGAEK